MGEGLACLDRRVQGQIDEMKDSSTLQYVAGKYLQTGYELWRGIVLSIVSREVLILLRIQTV